MSDQTASVLVGVIIGGVGGVLLGLLLGRLLSASAPKQARQLSSLIFFGLLAAAGIAIWAIAQGQLSK